MSRRSVDWNKGLARDLKGKEFAQAFIQESLAEGLSLKTVLGKVIRAYGVKEFSRKVKIPSSNLVRALSPKSNPTLETLNKLLRPFALEVAVTPRKKAA